MFSTTSIRTWWCCRPAPANRRTSIARPRSGAPGPVPCRFSASVWDFRPCPNISARSWANWTFRCTANRLPSLSPAIRCCSTG
ncbi:UNVERIFIED_CONTAM: hypothetical protein GTU68_048751 [Idotea baltica]|nr:hypothetical protein [Idotea baltica]